MSFIKNEKGATFAEYAVIGLLVLLVAYAGYALCGENVQIAVDKVAVVVRNLLQ